MDHHIRESCRTFLVSVITLFVMSTLVLPNVALASNSTSGSNVSSSSMDVIISTSPDAGLSPASELNDQSINIATRFFTENQGQYDEAARFTASTEFGKAVFCDSKIIYIINIHNNNDPNAVDLITLTFPGSNLVAPVGEGLESHRSNFFIGDQSDWTVGVRNYRSVEYHDLWEGIDLVYRFGEQGLKYEFVVAPFVPVSQVKVEVDSASLVCNADSLVFDTGRGSLIDGELMVRHSGSEEALPAGFVIQQNRFGFSAPQRDLSKAVIIDPLVYSTYIGGSENDSAYPIAVDSSGSTYVTGRANSTNFPISNAYQSTYGGGSFDVFVLKLNPAGSAPIYSTYIGGSGWDQGEAIVVDSNGNAYVTGYTGSINFPTSYPYQGIYRGGTYDAFVLKLNAAGSALVYSTYIGGSGDDLGHDIAVDASGNAYVTGSTSSTNFPLANANQSTNGGVDDVFVLKLKPTGSALIYSTFIGGNGEDVGNSIAIDSSGNAYVTGFTTSTNFPLVNAFQGTHSGTDDVFVLKLNPVGNVLLYSTYIGTSGEDSGNSIAVDSAGNICVTGYTNSTVFPISNAYQSTYGGGSFDAFILKFNPAGDTLLYSTYIGGNGDDGGYSLAIDSNDNVYVTGHTFSSNFPLANAYQSANGGGYDVFILKLNPAGDTLLYSTYIGGSGWDRGEGIVVDSNGNAYVTGRTTSTDFPLANEYQSTNGGLSDAFVLKFGYSTVPSAPQNLQAVAGNAQVALTWQAPAFNGGWDIANYTVYRGTTSGGETLLTTLPNVLTHTDVGLTNGQTYYYKVSAVNWAGGSLQSNETSATPVTKPSSPQSFQAAAGDTQITLTWQVPTSDGGATITGYSVYRGTVSGGETLLIALGNVLTHLDTGLTNGQIYYYKVTATNSVGESAQSIEVSATPAALPTAPQDLQASAGDTQVTLTWLEPLSNGGLAITNYRIYRGTTSGGEALLTTVGNVLTYTDTSLTNGQTYYYTVSATNSVGEGPQSSEISSVPVGPPSAPLNLRVTSGNTQATLSWSAPLTDGGYPVITYKIYRGIVSGVELYLTDVGAVLTYTDTGLTNGVTYYYKVSAANSLGAGPQSIEASATPATIPTAPQGLQSQAGDSYVLLAWIAPSSDGGSEITNYRVYKGTSSASLSLLTTLGNVLICNDTDVTNGVTYYYEIGATNALGDGPRSNQLSATPQTGIVHTVPSAPQDLQAIPGDAQVMLVWASPSDNGGLIITSFRIYRGTSAGATSYLATVGNVLSFTDHIVSNGVTYYYRVGAVNDVGEGAFSDEVSATPSSAISPSAPRNVSAGAGDSYVLLTWNAPLSNGSSAVTNYNVYRGTNSTSLSLLITVGGVLSYNDTSVVNGQTYYYMISAVNDVGEGDPSETVSATPTVARGPTGDNSILILAAIVILALIAIIIFAKMRKRK